MANHFVKTWGIRAPIDQAGRCLDLWLKEEERAMPKRWRARTAALLARYFQHEDEVTDQLMLSFLRHYSGWREIDMEDLSSVRMEIKTLLDKSAPKGMQPLNMLFAVTAAVVMTIICFCGWEMSRLKLTAEQQSSLKMRIRKIVSQNPGITHAAVWARIKKPIDVRRYQDISYWDYNKIIEMLDKWPAGASGAGM